MAPLSPLRVDLGAWCARQHELIAARLEADEQREAAAAAALAASLAEVRAVEARRTLQAALLQSFYAELDC